MNEVLRKEHSAYLNGIREPEDAICLISERMLECRPRVELTLRPFFRNVHMELAPISQMARMDLAKAFPQARMGDIIYIKTSATADRDSEAALNIAGGACIWLNGQKVYDESGSDKSIENVCRDDYHLVEVWLSKGANDLLIRCRKTSANWGLLFYIAYPRYPFRWTRDYLLSVRPTLPFSELEGIEGFAYLGPFPENSETKELCKDIEKGKVGYSDRLLLQAGFMTWQPRWDENCSRSRVDFTRAYGKRSGCAYALTYVPTERGKHYVFSLSSSAATKSWIDGQEVKARGRYLLEGNGGRMAVLVKLPRRGDTWWIEGTISDVETGQTINGVSLLASGSGGPVRWIIVGPFQTEMGDEMDIPFSPEIEIQFERPYPLGNYEYAFWRLPQEDVFIRPYRDGVFFGQWFYAVQVGLHGLMFAAKATGNVRQLNYYLDSIQTMADYYDYMKWDKQQFGNPTLTPRAWGLPDLDACGTIGVSMIEAFNITGNYKLLPVIQEIADAITQHIRRFSDGVFNRVETMWADDLFMSCPFLARFARLTGDAGYADEVYRQVDGYWKRLWIVDKRLLSHIFFVADGVMSRIPWGRGNGWIALALTEILTILPSDETRWLRVMGMFQEQMRGILAHQDESGMWHQVLDRPDSYPETSCTAMFVICMARGVLNGWLEPIHYVSAIQKGWEALMKYSVDAIGDVYGVCLGSGCAREARYYLDLPTKKNDDHGTGIILMAAAELIRLKERVRGTYQQHLHPR